MDSCEVDQTKPIFLSELTLDLRQRDVWRLLGDTYGLHRRLSLAFPEASEGGSGRVLFRVESGKGEAKILVQSAVEPNWSRLPEGMCDIIRGPKEWKIFDGSGLSIFKAEQQLRYRLRANPTYRSQELDAKYGKAKRGSRYACLTRITQADWLVRQGAEHGFALPDVPSGKDWLDAFADEPEENQRETRIDVRITPLENLTGNKPSGSDADKGHRLTHFGVDFEGILTVTDPNKFADAVACGIGPAKGFGFGLLSLARAS